MSKLFIVPLISPIAIRSHTSKYISDYLACTYARGGVKEYGMRRDVVRVDLWVQPPFPVARQRFLKWGCGFSFPCTTRDRGGGVQIEKNSLSRLTPPLDKVLPTTTGGGGRGSEGVQIGNFQSQNCTFSLSCRTHDRGGGYCQRVFS